MKFSAPCELIAAQLGSLFRCSTTGRGFIRIRTPFLYPDGGVVDVFLDDDTVTDFGEALGWLRVQTATGKRSPRQDRLVQDVVQTHGVTLRNGQLSLLVPESSRLAETVIGVAQAAVRVADIWFTARTRAVESVADEVADFLIENSISFERGPRVVGRSGRDWHPDFKTRVGHQTSLVFILSTGTRGAVRRVTEHAFTGCTDLQAMHGRCVSLFDDTADVWADEDFRLLEQVSSVARWSKPDEFEQLLKAA